MSHVPTHVVFEGYPLPPVLQLREFNPLADKKKRRSFEETQQKGDCAVTKEKKIYHGWRDQLTRDTHVTANGVDLRHVGTHSKTLEWGYSGSGPSDLAWSILADYLGDEEQAFQLHHQFKRHFVTGFGEWEWTLSAEQIESWLKQPTR